MKKLSIFIFFLFISAIISCNSEMIDKGISSMQDPRIPEINVKQGQDDIPNGSEYAFELANGISVDETCEPVIFTIENTGTADMELGAITINGENAEEFAVASQTDETILYPGTNTTFSITLTPQNADPKTADITITTNDFDEGEYTFTITGRSKPVCSFSARLRYGTTPMAVAFENKTQGDVESYLWNFGDGTTSAEANPTHTYTEIGTYTVELQVTGPGGFDYKYFNNYIETYRSEENVVDNYPEGVGSIKAVRINDDTRIDIISTLVLGSDTVVAWWKNDGTGNFSRNILPDAIAGTNDITYADINNDTYNDIVICASGADEKIIWWKNNGTGTTWTKNVVEGITASSWERVEAVDIEGDGDIDIVVSNSSEIAWWENIDLTPGEGDGDGSTWSGKITIASGLTDIVSVSASDIDGDGDADIACGQDYDLPAVGRVGWWRNLGDGDSWSVINVIGTETCNPVTVRIAEIDGINGKDIIILSRQDTDGEITWWENSGTETFGTAHIIENDFYSYNSDMNVADLDKDGDLDIFTCSYFFGIVAWLENPAAGNGGDWTRHVVSTGTYGSRSIQAADFNDDGNIDIAVATISASIWADKIIWWDLNLDGWEEYSVSVDFTDVERIFSSDVDSDGENDILAASSSTGEIAWWRNEGLGDMGNKQVIDTLYKAISVYACDIDNDGDTDIMAAGGDGTTDEFALWKNNGALSFTKTTLTASAIKGACFVSVADIDKDGDLDILGVASGDSTIYWWRNIRNREHYNHFIMWPKFSLPC